MLMGHVALSQAQQHNAVAGNGGAELALELHKQGYDRVRASHPDAAADEAVLEAMLASKN